LLDCRSLLGDIYVISQALFGLGLGLTSTLLRTRASVLFGLDIVLGFHVLLELVTRIVSRFLLGRHWREVVTVYEGSISRVLCECGFSSAQPSASILLRTD